MFLKEIVYCQCKGYFVEIKFREGKKKLVLINIKPTL